MAKIPLTQGVFAEVDRDDFQRLSVHKWTAQRTREGKFYAMRRDRGRLVLMHRLIAKTPKHLWTDHIDGDGLNNRKKNLRHVTPTQSAMNKAIQRGQTMKGAWLDRTCHNKNKWRATIRLHGKLTYLGRFFTQVEAAAAYQVAAKKMFGEYRRKGL